jgi:catechol 2,3-dioxygenase-like lactoylglutathione lyase family enzyme
MSLYVGSVVISVADIGRAVEFWSAALGYLPRDEPEDDWASLKDPRRPWANVSLQLSSEPKPHRNRLHLDLYADDQAAEVARLEGLGARRAQDWPYPPDADFVVLLDPDDNEFCVIDASPRSPEANRIG